MTPDLAPIAGFVLFVALLLHFVPLWRRDRLWFAVTVPAGFSETHEARGALRRYRTIVWVLSAAAVASLIGGSRLGLGWLAAFGMFVQAWLVPRLVPRIGELRAMILGLAAGALTLAIYGLAPVGWIFLLGTPIGALLGLFAPGFQALTTRRVGPNEQGRLQGANSGITGLTSMIAPAAFGYIYAATAQRDGGAAAGAAFIAAAALLALAAVVTAVAVAPHGKHEPA